MTNKNVYYHRKELSENEAIHVAEELICNAIAFSYDGCSGHTFTVDINNRKDLDTAIDNIKE